jgi:hypothetical protein
MNERWNDGKEGERDEDRTEEERRERKRRGLE